MKLRPALPRYYEPRPRDVGDDGFAATTLNKLLLLGAPDRLGALRPALAAALGARASLTVASRTCSRCAAASVQARAASPRCSSTSAATRAARSRSATARTTSRCSSSSRARAASRSRWARARAGPARRGHRDDGHERRGRRAPRFGAVLSEEGDPASRRIRRRDTRTRGGAGRRVIAGLRRGISNIDVRGLR